MSDIYQNCSMECPNCKKKCDRQTELAGSQDRSFRRRPSRNRAARASNCERSSEPHLFARVGRAAACRRANASAQNAVRSESDAQSRPLCRRNLALRVVAVSWTMVRKPGMAPVEFRLSIALFLAIGALHGTVLIDVAHPSSSLGTKR